MNDLRTEVQKLLDFYARRVWPWDIDRELMPSMAALSAALSQTQAEPNPFTTTPVAAHIPASVDDKRDAERYRWLRTAGAWQSEIAMEVLSEDPTKFDEAVDLSMSYDVTGKYSIDVSHE